MALSGGATVGPAFTQTGRLLAVETALGDDVLLLSAVDGLDAVSRGYVYTVEMFTRASDDDVRTLLGQPMTLWLRNDSVVERRPVHGHVRRLSLLNTSQRIYRHWRAELVPWMWFMTKSVDCRVYQNLTVPEIVGQVLTDQGVQQYEFRLDETYKKLDFCVQYRESAFAFVSRLMEHVGIFYWFEHYPDRHVLVMADQNGLAPLTTPGEAMLAPRHAMPGDLGSIHEMQHEFSFRSGKSALKDYDFEVPTKILHTKENTTLNIPLMDQFEIFDYPGGYTDADEGARLVRLRMELEEGRHHRINGSGTCAGFDPGRRFFLMPDGSASSDDSNHYFLTEVRHHARDESYLIAEEKSHYENEFICMPAETSFRPELLTPKPVIQGQQTAVVTGPAGESIHTDEYGRVKVLFHWDRYGKRDDTSSCWIRVSEHSAGSYWGALAIPHVGQEVVIGFLEGDPDRPIVVGRVYNGTNVPPVTLPRDKHKMVIRDHGDNRLIMHGKPGFERMTLVSPKNINFVAMRSPAKALSAQTIDGVTFPDYEDGASLAELQVVYQQLLQAEGQSGAADSNPTGTYFTTPDSTPATNTSPAGLESADAGASVDINTLTEHDLNSLSVENTNAWVGKNMNSWVNGDSNSWVNGNATSNVTGSSTTQITGGASTTINDSNHTFVTGNNTQVVTGTNDQAVFLLNSSLVFGGNFQAVMPLSLQLFVGVNSQITVGIASQVTLGVSEQYAATNVQQFGVNVQHNGTNLSWDDVTLGTKELAVETATFKLNNAGLMLFT